MARRRRCELVGRKKGVCVYRFWGSSIWAMAWALWDLDLRLRAMYGSMPTRAARPNATATQVPITPARLSAFSLILLSGRDGFRGGMAAGRVTLGGDGRVSTKAV